jgi:hypothetical protein
METDLFRGRRSSTVVIDSYSTRHYRGEQEEELEDSNREMAHEISIELGK